MMVMMMAMMVTMLVMMLGTISILFARILYDRAVSLPGLSKLVLINALARE